MSRESVFENKGTGFFLLPRLWLLFVGILLRRYCQGLIKASQKIQKQNLRKAEAVDSKILSQKSTKIGQVLPSILYSIHTFKRFFQSSCLRSRHLTNSKSFPWQRHVARKAPIFKNLTTFQTTIYCQVAGSIDTSRKSCLGVFLQG